MNREEVGRIIEEYNLNVDPSLHDQMVFQLAREWIVMRAVIQFYAEVNDGGQEAIMKLKELDEDFYRDRRFPI